MPGGPVRRMPLGSLPPNRVNFCGSRRYSTTSISSCFASSTPSTSENLYFDADVLGSAPEGMVTVLPRPARSSINAEKAEMPTIVMTRIRANRKNICFIARHTDTDTHTER